MHRDTVVVAASIGESYALPLAVMLHSLVERLRPPQRPVLHLLHRGLSPLALDVIGGIVETIAVRIPPEAVARLPSDPHFPPEAAAPLLLPGLLPASLDRVFFLDADTLVVDDVGPLWRLDLGGRAIAAAADPAIPRCDAARGVKGSARRGIPPRTPYFNAGVMLLDLAAWRDRRITERAIDYLHATRGRTDFYHQEALNAVAWNDWLPLPARWNLPPTAGRLFDAAPQGDPAIVHFSGRMKPWRMRVGGRFAGNYAATLARVDPRLARPAAALGDRLLGGYDRTIRPLCRPLERLLWSLRAI